MRFLAVLVLLVLAAAAFLAYFVLPWLAAASILFLFLRWTGQIFLTPDAWFMAMAVICIAILFFSPKGFRPQKKPTMRTVPPNDSPADNR